MTKLSFGKGIAAILLAILAVASSAGAQATFNPPVPIITSISPVSAVPGGAQFTLTVNGANFVAANSTVQWNGVGVTTDVVSSTQLTATISAALIANAGTAAVSVLNSGTKIESVPSRNGATPAGVPVPFHVVSNVFYFPVTAAIAAVKVTSAMVPAGSFPFRIAMGDFNADGNLDMAVSNLISGTVSILLGKGDGTFQTQTTITTLANPEGMAVGDLNGDGNLDLVIGGNGTGLNVALGDGTGAFTLTALTGASSPISPVLADLNGDGFLDIVVGNGGVHGILVYLGKGDGTFQAPVTYTSAGQVFSVVVADFNGDGKLDIAAANFVTGNVDVYLGDGTGAFGTATSSTAVAGAWALAAGDFDKDGILDLAVASNSNAGNGIVLLRGKGDGTFQAPSNVVASGIFLGLTSGDLSNDGNMDLVSILGGNGATQGLVQAWFGNGDGTFQAPQTVTNFGGQNGVALGGFGSSAGLMTVSTGFQSVNVSQQTATLAPTSHSFGSVNVGSPLAFVFTLTNSTGAAFTPTAFTFTGTNAADFSVTTNTCTSSVAAGGSCAITVAFTPSATGARSATLNVADSAAGSPQTAALSGTGVAMPAAVPSVTTLPFGSQNITVTTASLPVTLTNSGGATLTGLAISIIGTNSADFAQTNNCTATLAVSTSCVVNVTFTPSALGARTATLQFTDNASNSPQTVALTGTGVQVAQKLLYIAAPPTTIMAGGNLGVITVGVYTMQGMLITSATTSLMVTVNGPNSFHSVLSASAVAGVATFDFSGVPLDAAGQYTITASNQATVQSNGAGGLVSAVATTIVTPQNSSIHMSVSGYPSPTFAGIAHTFVVSVTDAFGNPITTYTGTVTLSSTDSAAVLTPSPYTFVNDDMGAHTFTGTLNSAGTQTISATDGQLSGSQTGIVVNARPHFIVNTLADDLGTALCDGNEACSLRSAVNQSNTDGVGDITVDDSGFEGAPPFTVTLSLGALELNSNITITGPGEQVLQISGNNAITVFQVDGGAVATLSALTVTQGVSANNGGGITNAGSLTLNNVAVINSAAVLDGGGIYNTGTLTVNSSMISGNSASVDGGGVGSTGTVVFYDSTISGNTATGNGGGIDNAGPLSVPQSTFFGNAASDGSAIENEDSGTALLLQCTITGNSASGGAGATIHNLSEKGAAVTLLNSIDGGNASVAGDCMNCGTQSTFNLINVSGETLNLGPLANNGGPTLTLLPQPGSPAIGAGSVAAIAGANLPQSLANDQRGAGFVRVVNGVVDLGSVQANAGPAAFLTLTVADTSIAGQPLQVTVAAFTANENPAAAFADTIHFTSSDPQAQLPADYTFTGQDAGTHVFTVSLETSGTQTITATDVQHPSLTATQTVTAAAAAASSIVAVAGSGQTATPGSTFAIALAAKVTDAFGNPIPAVSVTFTAPTTGASGTFGGGVNTVIISTLSTGIATASAFTANSTAGQYIVTAGASAQPGATGKSMLHPAETSLTPANFTLTNGVPPSYTVTANPSALTIIQGQSGTTVLTFTPVGGFTGTVSLTCSGLPADSDCVFVPAQAVMTGNNQIVTVTLTVNTTGTNGQMSQVWPGTHRGPRARNSNAKLPALFGMFLALAILGWSATRSKRPRFALAVFALALAGAGLTACTHRHATSTAATVPGTYPVNVTASVGTGGTQTAVVTITIVKE